MLFPLLMLLVGAIIVAGTGGGLWLVRSWVRRQSRRTQLGLGMAAWTAEALVLIIVILLVSGPLLPQAVRDPGLLNQGWVEVGAALGIVGALALLAWAWGVPSWRDVGFLWRGLAGGQVGRDIAFGLALGPLAVGVFLVAGLIGGWDRIAGLAPPGELIGNLALGVILFACVGVVEEVAGRGCLFALLARWAGLPVAWVVSVGVFALLHGGNPGATPVAILGVGLAGVVFAFTLLRSGTLWLPIAFHLSWDWAETSLYGFPDSGIPPASALKLVIDPTAPDWATGGAFGPESSVFVILALALATAAIWIYTRQRNGPAILFPAGVPERSPAATVAAPELSSEAPG
jgi:membrane protease YdiL (CAAX protease family)